MIKTENKDVTVKVSGDGGDVRVLDASSGASFDIRSGEFTITAVGKDGKTEFEVVPNQLTMRRGGRKVVTVTQKSKATSPAPPSVTDQVGDNANTKDTAELLYRGQGLSDWRKVLEVDRDPQTQVEALKACASLYMSSGQHDEFKTLLQSYIQRNGIYRDSAPESTICYSGFEASLKKLPPQEIADFFKRQLKEGTVTSIDWAFRAMESSGTPFLTSDIHRELKSNPVELLRLIAAREDGEAGFAKLQKYKLTALVLDLIEGRSASDETVNLITAIMVKLRPDEILKLATRVPKRALTPQLFAPVMDLLLREKTSDGERLQLIQRMVEVEKDTDNHASFLQTMLESHAIELLRLTAKRDSSDKTRELFVYIVENLLKDPLSDDAEDAVRGVMVAEDAVRGVMVKLKRKDFFIVATEFPKLALDEKNYASLNAQLFAADTKPKERDDLIKTLTSIEKRAKGKAAFILKTLAKVVANQIYATDKINFDKLKEMKVYAAKQPSKDEKSYQVTQMFIYDGFANVEISGNAVVARNLLSGICKRLISRDVSSNKEVAKAVFEILSNPPSSERVSDPAKLEHFKQLRIEDDIEQLGKLATNQPGQFSEFISGSPKFKGDLEISQNAETTKALSGSSPALKPLKQTAKPLPQPKQSSIGERNAGGTDDGQAPALYRGKPLAAWKKTLVVDRDPQTQADALKACANLCLSSGQHDEFKALLQSYIQRNKSLYRGEESTVCFSGFEDSLRKLPPQEIAAFFKRQLKQGTATSINWTFRGMTSRRDPSSVPFSKKLGQELETDSVEILRLIDARDKSESVSYLLDFVLVWLVKDQPVSDEAVDLITSVMARSTADQIIRTASYVPKRAFTPQLFAPVKARLLAADTTASERLWLTDRLIIVAKSRGDDASFLLKMLRSDAIEMLRLTAKSKNQTDTSKKLLLYFIKNLHDDPLTTDEINAVRSVMGKLEPVDFWKAINGGSNMRSEVYVPNSVLNEKLFAPFHAQLFAADTKPKDRNELINRFIKVEERADGQAAFILKTLAEVVANQMYAANKVSFDGLQKMTVQVRKKPADPPEEYRYHATMTRYDYKVLELTGNAVVVRELLTQICEQLQSEETLDRKEVAKSVLKIISDRSSKVDAADPAKLEHFKQLRIEHDLEELKKFSENQSGEFSEFVRGSRKFKSDPEISQTTETTNALSTSSTSPNSGSKVITVKLVAGDDGELKSIIVDKTKTYAGDDRFQKLTDYFAQKFSSMDEAQRREYEVELETSPDLHYRYTVKAIEAVSRTHEEGGSVKKLVETIKMKVKSKDDVDPLSRALYRGKRLNEWLKVLKTDQDPKTQGEAVVACATLYESRR